jgi:RNA polymerase sigma-70 factor (ECF subfamily)
MNNNLSDEGTLSEDLMARVAKGDNYAFEALVKRHQRTVLNLIYRFMGKRTKAEDLAQEVFIRVWQAAGRYKRTAKFNTWIYRITANLCLNELKSARRRKLLFLSSSGGKGENREDRYFEPGADREPSPEDLLLTAERNRQVSAALRSLPANQRLAVILKRYDDLSYREIAQILGCSVSAVDSLLVRAKRNLRKNLIPYEK